MTHILIISQIFPPDLGGAATRAYNVARGLAMNDVKVTVVAGFPHYPTGNVPRNLRRRAFSLNYIDGLKVLRTWVPPLAAKGLVNRAILFVTFLISSIFPMTFIKKVDAIFASNPQLFSIFSALIYKISHRCPIILNVDDLWPEDPIEFGLIRSRFMKKVGRLIAKIAYRLADVIIPISPGYTEVICRNYGIKKEKVHVIRAGVDLSRFKMSNKSLNNKNRKAFTVLYSGAFSIAYDFDQVLLAAKSLESLEGIKFILQGGGELAPYLKARVKQLKLRNVKVVDKILSREDVAKLLGEADALLLPLRDFGKPYLGISSKLYEYQAVGRPIICCADGQPAEHVKETKSGIVVKPGDHEALARAVLNLMHNASLAERLASNGRKYVESSLAIERIGRQILQLLSDLSEIKIKI